MTAIARRDIAGGAVATTLTGSINSTDLAIPLAASTGWPSGTLGEFYVVIDRGLATEEKVLCASRTGLNITVASTGKRGVDGTAAQSHASGAAIEHCGTAADLDEANKHIADVTRDDHTQYMRKAQNLADLANAGTARTNLGLGSLATQDAGAVAISGGTVAGITDIAVADGGTGASTAAGARSNLGLAVGTDVQAFDADLLAIAALISAANKLPYSTGVGAWSLADFTAFARTLLDDADAAAMRTTLGLGTLATKSAIASADITDGTIVAADAAASFFAETNAVVKTHMKSASGGQTAITGTSSGTATLLPMKTTHTITVTRAGQTFEVDGLVNIEYTGGTGGGDKKEAVTELFVDGVRWDEVEGGETFTSQIIGKGNIASVLFRLNIGQKWVVTGQSVGTHTLELKGWKVSSGDTVVADDGHTCIVSKRFG